MSRRNLCKSFAVLAFLTAFSCLWAAARSVAGDNTSRLPSLALDRGPEDPTKVLQLTLWLALHNKAEFDQRVQKLYDPGSPTYHQWLNISDVASYVPGNSEIEILKAELTAHHLTITGTEPNHLALRVSGTVADIEAAFHTPINRYEFNRNIYHANVADPQLEGDVTGLIYSISGLENTSPRAMVERQIDLSTGQARAAVPLSISQGKTFSSTCFYPAKTITLTAAGSQYPRATYSGLTYGASPKNTAQGSLGPCGYSVGQVRSLYGLFGAYAKGLDGSGQTLVIVDPNGSPNLSRDIAAFALRYALPAYTRQNLQVIYPQGMPLLQDPRAALETVLDVEWAHAIAPGAKIDLLIAPASEDQELQYALLYAVTHKLGGVISNSWGLPEALYSPAALNTYNQIIEVGAAEGISIHFASGDSGDYLAEVGIHSPIAPADSPYATSVGGTSLGVPLDGGGITQTGWGTNLTYLSYGTGEVEFPPMVRGFYSGTGGGESLYFPKPSWQKSLPGVYRQQPDISALADPATGVEVIATEDGVQGVTVIGGTSLATPIFSGFWAIANQKAGHWLGQAAPLLSRLPPNAINDIVPVSSTQNVQGQILEPGESVDYSPDALAGPLGNTWDFVSAIAQVTSGGYYVITFGTDSSLAVTSGWDNVTGYGTPNGLNFVDAAAALAALPPATHP